MLSRLTMINHATSSSPLISPHPTVYIMTSTPSSIISQIPSVRIIDNRVSGRKKKGGVNKRRETFFLQRDHKITRWKIIIWYDSMTV